MHSTINGILHCLNKFRAYGLTDLSDAILMDRIDTKFIVPTNQLPDLLAELTAFYKILEIDNKRIFHYKSTYFDTEDMLFYHMHHRGKLPRYKVRQRSYVDVGTHFFEIKRKDNKKRTTKNRVEVSTNESYIPDAGITLLQETGIKTRNNLSASLENSYYRLSLANEQQAERLTIDLDLKCKNLRTGDASEFNSPKFAIIELKQKKLNRQSPFFKLAAKHKARKISFSKYCIGLGLTNGFEQGYFQHGVNTNHANICSFSTNSFNASSSNTHTPNTPKPNPHGSNTHRPPSSNTYLKKNRFKPTLKKALTYCVS